ncbi:MAG: hypothetical protein D9V45_12455 [Chloroflexi bacterium]|nr:MAG: hypothetical protein D9V45_12455 [Chloroflexota bacterium]
MDSNRLEILQKIESGEVTPEDGLRRLNAIEDAQLTTGQEFASLKTNPAVEVISPAHPDEGSTPDADMPDFARFRVISWALFGAFLLLTLISANWMIQSWQTSPYGWGFWLSWIPFAIGVLGMATSLNTRWLHVRVSEMENGKRKNIRISLPLPLGLVSWFFKLNPSWLPQEMRSKNIGETLNEVNQSISRNEPFFIEVNEDDQHVEIYIG